MLSRGYFIFSTLFQTDHLWFKLKRTVHSEKEKHFQEVLEKTLTLGQL